MPAISYCTCSKCGKIVLSHDPDENAEDRLVEYGVCCKGRRGRSGQFSLFCCEDCRLGGSGDDKCSSELAQLGIFCAECCCSTLACGFLPPRDGTNGLFDRVWNAGTVGLADAVDTDGGIVGVPALCLGT